MELHLPIFVLRMAKRGKLRTSVEGSRRRRYQVVIKTIVAVARVHCQSARRYLKLETRVIFPTGLELYE